MISERTKSILLITGYLKGGSSATGKPLSNTEWNKLVIYLQQKGLLPEDLLSNKLKSIFSSWSDSKINVERLEKLLQRGAALGIALDKWERAGIWILNRGDKEYPLRLRKVLKGLAPPLLFGIGNKKLLETSSIGVVGSRKASSEDLATTFTFGKQVVNEGYSIVSGGARGIDESSMLGALDNEGACIGVLADSLLTKASSKLYRDYVLRKSLVLISPNNPEARFNVGTAMGRNKLIYAFSQATVVIHSGKKGGTWTGALENLRNKWVPLWVKNHTDPDAGNTAIIKKGGNVLPESSEDWKVDLLTSAQNQILPKQNLFNTTSIIKKEESGKKTESIEEVKPENESNADTVTQLLEKSWSTEDILYVHFISYFKDLTEKEAMSKNDLAKKFDVLPKQISMWLERGIRSKEVLKLNKPVRFKFDSK